MDMNRGTERQFRKSPRRLAFPVVGTALLWLAIAGCRHEAPPADGTPALAVAPFSAQQAKAHQEAWAAHLGLPAELTNSIGMKFTLIPPGEFMMGSPRWEDGRFSDEGPRRRVQITRPFYLGVYPVTHEEYERVTGANPSSFSPDGGRSDWVSGLDTSRFPVERVSWEDAVEFCRKLSALPDEHTAGREYRLSTEAEWEYACRAGTTSPFHFGSLLDGSQANCDGNHPYGTSTTGPYLRRTTTVGSYAPNAFGLHDMHGNVWQWCADWYDVDYYANSPVDDPPGPASGSSRVCRGGSWRFGGRYLRSANRNCYEPGHRSFSLGFRVALVAAGE